MLRTSVGVQTQHAHHEQGAGGSDAATQHEEQPVAGAAPSTAHPRADGQVKQLGTDRQTIRLWSSLPALHG